VRAARKAASAAVSLPSAGSEVGDLGAFAREARSLLQELVAVDRARDDLARDAHQLLLVLDQAQADLLLRHLAVALDRFLLTLEFLIAQVPKRQDDGREEEHHRDQRTQRGETILARRGLAPPPAAEQSFGPGAGRARERRGLVGRLHGRIIKAAGNDLASQDKQRATDTDYPVKIHNMKLLRTIWNFK
jgi:hypothetical protein